MAMERRGPFWDMLEGRLPAPAAARLLGWKLERIDPEQGAIRVQFEGKPEFLTLGPAAAALLGGEAFAQTLELKTTATARVIPFQALRSSA